MKRYLICIICLVTALSVLLPFTVHATENVMNVPNLQTDRYSSPVNVAVIDTGIADSYRLDKSRILEGKNYVYEDATTEDLVGHGTAVASIILGTVDGVLTSLAPTARVVPLVNYTKSSNGEDVSAGISGLARAIREAIDVFDCRVINLSSGYAYNAQELAEAVAYAEEKGVIIVASVGNLGYEAVEYYPAAYESTVGVGSVGQNGTVSYFSQRNYTVTVGALGEDVRVLDVSDYYVSVNGSSYAAAYVSAFAARLASFYPELDARTFREIITMTARDSGSEGYDSSYGYGIIDMARAEEYAAEYFDEVDYGDSYLPYTDITGTEWFADAVRYCSIHGYFVGMEDGSFRPNIPATRAMAVTALYRVHVARFGREEYLPQHHFVDCEDGSWYEEALCWGFANGLVNGVSDTEFMPSRAISRQEAAKLVCRYLERFNAEALGDGVADLADYADSHLVAEYAREPFAKLCAVGIFNGDHEKRLLPFSNLSRCELAALIQRMARTFENV